MLVQLAQSRHGRDHRPESNAWSTQAEAYKEPMRENAPLIKSVDYEVYPESEEFIEEIKQAAGSSSQRTTLLA